MVLTKAWLLSRGYYINRGVLAVLILGPMLLLVGLFIQRRMNLVARIEQDLAGYGIVIEDDEDEDVKGFDYTKALKKGLSPRMYEYIGLLRTFDLGPEADLRDIKGAYRQAVKAVHPDVNPQATEDDKKLFVEYTSAYERIVDLRKSLGLAMD